MCLLDHCITGCQLLNFPYCCKLSNWSIISRFVILCATVWQDAALLTLDMAQRGDVDLLAASLDQLVAADAGIAAVQACLAIDGNLRQRYAKVGPACHGETHASKPKLTPSLRRSSVCSCIHACVLYYCTVVDTVHAKIQTALVMNDDGVHAECGSLQTGCARLLVQSASALRRPGHRLAGPPLARREAGFHACSAPSA